MSENMQKPTVLVEKITGYTKDTYDVNGVFYIVDTIRTTYKIHESKFAPTTRELRKNHDIQIKKLGLEIVSAKVL
ncbi:MAG: hypothetical protein LBO08_01935 [Rickettsiales bacterium]|jgi:hypothetical protein|nr:hypothetical protein [Rickettsiales bacterium]